MINNTSLVLVRRIYYQNTCNWSKLRISDYDTYCYNTGKMFTSKTPSIFKFIPKYPPLSIDLKYNSECTEVSTTPKDRRNPLGIIRRSLVFSDESPRDDSHSSRRF